MANIGVVICNYNKKDYVIKCIESVKKQNIKELDIYVVDNASTDGSAERIHEIFGDSVNLIINKENLGGSGGFNSGIRKTLQKNYEYLVLLDNDIVLDENCIKNWYDTMCENREIGIQGCKILKMDYPDVIQEFAPVVNYETMTFELCHGGEEDSAALPDIEDCDYVPACALMVRTDVIRKIGLMPEENFIYYDDIEWGIRCHRAGYRVVANSNAKVWHKGGAGVNPTTFSTYYLNRNKVKFFMKYMQTEGGNAITEELIDKRADAILLDTFQGIYMCLYNHFPNIVKTKMEAFLDALEGKSGKAEPYMIREREINNKFEEVIGTKETILVKMNGYTENARRIIFRINIYEKEKGKKFNIIVTDDSLSEETELLGYEIQKGSDLKFESDLTINVCKHILSDAFELTENEIFVDGWCNMAINEEDINLCRRFEDEFNNFKLYFGDRIKNIIKNTIS